MKTLNSDANSNHSPNQFSLVKKPDMELPNRFNTVNSEYFNKTRFNSVTNNTEKENEMKLQKFLKGTTYSIGKTGLNEIAISTAKQTFIQKNLGGPLPGRYNQEEQTGKTNANKVANITFNVNTPALNRTVDDRAD